MNTKYMLWTEEEMIARSGSGRGTFESCKPSMEFYKSDTSFNSQNGCVVICPGGGYEFKSSELEGKNIAEFFISNGIDAYVLDYRLSPDRHPAPLADVLKAIELARENAEELGYKKDKIAILGFSAGGHLAASAGTMWSSEKCRPDAMVLCYPVITMGKFTHIGSKGNLMGEFTTETLSSDLSCENRVTKSTPPTFIWHTADDEVVRVENSLLMATALSAKNIPYEMHIYPTGRHGLDLAHDLKDVSEWSKNCIRWLKSMGW